jgi:DNA polymerase I-like protein with 3'-5' exonuclease and polymerase domains
MTWWVSTLRQLEDAIDFHLGNGEFVIDVETRGEFPLDPRRNEVYWIVLAGPGRTDVIPFGHPVGEQNGTTKEPRLCNDGKIRNYTIPTFGPPPAQLRPADVMSALKRLLFSDCLKIGHNIKFDLESLEKYFGERIPGPYADTWAVFLLNENRHDYRLGPVVERLFGHKLDKSISGVLDKTAFAKVLRYVHRDGRFTWLTWVKLRESLHTRPG